MVLKNTHPTAATIELREQVPVSGQADVQVTWKGIAGATPVEEHSGSGILVFEFPLPAKGTTTTSWGYQVEYPADRWLGWME